jgi:hypothetical protein
MVPDAELRHNVGMRLEVALVLLAACGVQIDGSKPIDAGDNRILDATPGDTPPDTRACTGGDMNMTVGSECLMLFTATPRNWTDANNACLNAGAHLAVLDTATKHSAAKALAGTNNAWIGLTDIATENQFRWVDNTPFSFTAWDPNEPSNGAGVYEEDCVVIAGARGGDWDDRPCSPQIANAPAGCCTYAYLCQF